MREWCACGAAIRSTPKRVLEWRANHRHPGAEPDPEPERNGAHAHVENAGGRYFESESAWSQDVPIVNARRRAGF